jgi:hypothetical protein
MEANRDDQKGRTSCHEATETEPDPGMVQSIEKRCEIPYEEATVMPVREPRKRCRVRNLAEERHQKMKERLGGEKENPGGSWPSHARMCPAIQKWHGGKGTSSGMFRPKGIVEHARNWSSLAAR